MSERKVKNTKAISEDEIAQGFLTPVVRELLRELREAYPDVEEVNLLVIAEGKVISAEPATFSGKGPLNDAAVKFYSEES